MASFAPGCDWIGSVVHEVLVIQELQYAIIPGQTKWTGSKASVNLVLDF